MTTIGWSVFIAWVLVLLLSVDSRAAEPDTSQSPSKVSTSQSAISADKEIEKMNRVQASLEQHVQSMFASMSDDARTGYKFLTENVYLPHDFNQHVLNRVVETRLIVPMKDAPKVSEEQATWRAFGLAPRHDDTSKPLQYVVTDDKRYVMNCFACHGGNTFGATFPGAPNTLYSLESLTENVRRIKLKEEIPLSHMDVGSVFMPLGTSVGTSNAVMFGVALMNFRDKDLNVLNRPPAAMTHHDMDAPPWWNFSIKKHIYIDGFADKGHKGLMQFMLVRQNGPEKFRTWAGDFEKVYQFISELTPPPYPLDVNHELASQGKAVFLKQCATCHGVDNDYPELNVPIKEIGTDPVRWESLTPAHRKHYGDSWFADYGKQDTIDSPEGYTAPPLRGIWASAPYLHNGSVPTLWHLLNPDKRPKVWKRSSWAFDDEKVGFHVDELDTVPAKLSSFDRRWYFNTSVRGKSAEGHNFPNALSDAEKQAVLEYLKTL